MKDTPVVVVILAGGRGTRMWPLTQDLPKSLVRVGGVPILSQQLAWIAEHGAAEVIIAAGYLGERITRFLEAAEPPLPARVVIERSPLGRGGALRNALSCSAYPPDALVLVLNGDVLTSLDPSAMVRQLKDQDLTAVVAVRSIPTTWAIVDVKDERAVSFSQERNVVSDLGFGGVALLGPKSRRMLPTSGDLELTLYPQLARAGELGAFQAGDTVVSFDSIRDVELYESRPRSPDPGSIETTTRT